MAIDSNDNYIHKVSENTSFTFVDFVDLKIFKFKSRKLFWDTMHAVDYPSDARIIKVVLSCHGKKVSKTPSTTRYCCCPRGHMLHI